MSAQRAALAAATLCLALFAAVPVAHAAYEQVGCFAGYFPGLTDSCKPVPEEELKKEGFKFSEEVQLGGVGGMAVNYTGAGGVEPGTLYAATWGPELRIEMYVPRPDGGLRFSQAWQVTTVEGPYERCGPDAGQLLHPTCPARVEASPEGVDVDVDQSTGNVYAFNGAAFTAGMMMITEYAADGSKVISRFGEKAPGGQVVGESPAKIHESPYPGGMAVNGDGEVYVFDINNSGSFYHRLMVFEPKAPGDYSEYEYAGEVAAGFFGEGLFPINPVTDAAGNVYVATGDIIEMYHPEAPQPYPGKPATVVCHFAYLKEGIKALAVNQLSGKPFFYSEKKETKARWVRQLGSCEGGAFKETGKAAVLPERAELTALAFDPTRRLQPSRPPGIIYGGAPGPVPDTGAGEPGQTSLGYLFAQPKGPAKTLTVVKEGTGTGTVTSSPEGIECGGACSTEFPEGETVTLTAKADPGSEFKGWSGPGCSGTATCKATMSEAKEVTATFEAEETEEPGIPLQVSTEGTGAGTVTADKGLISCEPFCEDEYPEGAVVTLTASPSEGSLFMAWRHCDSGGINGRQCTVIVDQAKQVSALFYTAHTLSVAKAEGSGPGKLQAYGGIACIYGCKSTAASFPEGAKVTLKATPAKHFHLASWGGDCSGAGACELSMGEEHEVEALFVQDPRLSLSLSKTGGGQALVKTRPAGILCGYTCNAVQASFYEGEALEVKWKLSKGTKSLTWSEGAGACTGASEAPEGSCTLSMDAAKELVAELE